MVSNGVSQCCVEAERALRLVSAPPLTLSPNTAELRA
jgi:hypothetical protein